jgi:hypothetical protein
MAARLTTYLVVGIVAATLIAGLIVGAQRDDSDGPVDLIIHNATVFTADADGSVEQAIAVRGNQILRVGSNREILRLRRPQTMVIDANGGSVLPGFNDAHTHLMEGALAQGQIDLTDAASASEIENRITVWADANPDAAWILGRGWQSAAFDGTLPTRQQLDALTGARPAMLLSRDGHTAWVNTAALRAAAIARATTVPGRGEIVRDPRTAEATGIVRGAAIELVTKGIPAPKDGDRARALRAAILRAHEAGVTSVHDVDSSTSDLEMLDAARRDGELSIRVYAGLHLDAVDEQALASLETVRKQYGDDPLLKTGAIVMEVDGGLDSRAAALVESYADDSGTAPAAIDPDALNRMVRLADARGWQVVLHATGDRAVRMAVNAIEHAERSNPTPPRQRRHRIEGLQIVDRADLRRMAQFDVVASLQPRVDDMFESVLTKRLGRERAASAGNYRTVAGAGGRVVLGTDWPAGAATPLEALQAVVASERGLPIEDAVRAFTASPAWASFDEQRKGTLEAGMLADITVLSDDIFDLPPAKIGSAAVTVTVLDGKIVYRKGVRLN